MPFIEQLGQQMAGEAAQAGMGLILGGINDRRQIKQQQKLQDMQIAGSKELTDYNTAKQLQMWKDTSYSAQIEQMKKANVNPALMYGIGGGGGGSTNVATGQVSGGDAPKGGGEAVALMGQQAQYALLNAQTKNIEADTKLKEADAANRPIQGANIKADTELKGTETRLKGLEAELKGKTMQDQIDIVSQEQLRSMEMLEQEARRTNMQKATMLAEIDRIREEALSAFVRNNLMRQQIKQSKQGVKESESNIKVNEGQIRRMIEQGVQDWRRIGNEGANVDTHRNAQLEEQMKNDEMNGNIIGLIEKAIQAIIIKDVIKQKLPPPIWKGGSR